LRPFRGGRGSDDRAARLGPFRVRRIAGHLAGGLPAAHRGVGLRGGGRWHGGGGTRAVARADPAPRPVSGDGVLCTRWPLVAAVAAARLDEPHRADGVHHLVDAGAERSDPARRRPTRRAAARARSPGLRVGDARPWPAPLPPPLQRTIASAAAIAEFPTACTP